MGQSGVMNLGAFVDRLGGRMDDRRAALVSEAFDRLDTSGTGHLALDEVYTCVNFIRSSPMVLHREKLSAFFEVSLPSVLQVLNTRSSSLT